MNRLLTCLLGLTFAAGCGQDNRSREPEPMAVEDTVFGDQVEQIQRADLPNIRRPRDSQATFPYLFVTNLPKDSHRYWTFSKMAL